MSLTWYPSRQPVSYLDLRLPGGLLYAVDGHIDWPGEPSAIYLQLPVAAAAEDARVDLGYYPHYRELTPAQRRSYLEWLKNGRRDESSELRALGYLFLFFYGIERRICLDRDTDPALVNEVLALLREYGPHHKSRSLRGYFLSLAHYGGWQQGHAAYRDVWPQMVELDDGKTGEEAMKLILANLFEIGEPLHWSIAYRMAMADPGCRRSVVVTKAKRQFWDLFQQRYENEFPGGIKLKAARQTTVARYQPASAAMLAHAGSRSRWPFETKIVNVLGHHSQFRRVSEIWNACVDDLSGYSRAVTSKKSDAAGLKAWLALPTELRKSSPSPMQPFWEWMSQHAPREGLYHFVTIGSLAPWLGLSERAKLTRAQSLELAYAAASMGWNVAPHPLHVDQPYTWAQEVALYPRETEKPVEPHVPGLVRLLYLVMPVASADGTVEREELDAFHNLISHEVKLERDWQYLLAVEAVLMRDTNIALKALPTMAKHISGRNRRSVLKLLMHIAAADGEIAPEEFKILHRVARAFDLPKETIQQFIEEDVAFKEVVISEPAREARKGEPIPERPRSATSGLVLDMDRVAALTRETHEVVAMLSVVMTDETLVESDLEPSLPATKGPVDVSPEDPTWLQALDERFHKVVAELVRHDEMPSEDFAAVAAQHHLLADDVFNSVNAWADETLGDFLLERSDPVRIYRNLIPSTVLT